MGRTGARAVQTPAIGAGAIPTGALRRRFGNATLAQSWFQPVGNAPMRFGVKPFAKALGPPVQGPKFVEPQISSTSIHEQRTAANRC